MSRQAAAAGNVRSLVLRIVLGLIAAGMCAAIIVYVALKKPPPVKASPIQARLELAAGEVTLTRGDDTAKVVSGTPIMADSKISTAKGARALIRLPDGSTLFMRDNSELSLSEDAVTLASGEYWVDAPPTDRRPLVHRIGATEVSATEAGLSIRTGGEATSVYVARGMATVTGKGGRVEVNSGEQATIKGEKAPEVAPLSFWDDWTGGMADFNAGLGMPGQGTGTIYGVDVGAEPGSPARRLEIQRQVVHAVVREGLSETEVDQTFFNPGERAVEGWYWFTVPERASVTGFALETDGTLVEGEFIEKKEAAAKYGEAKSTGHAPAILEWVDNRTYRARIYPINAGSTRRVVLRYIELKPIVDQRLEYIYPMGAKNPARIGEFALTVDLGDPGKQMKIATLADARVEDAGKRVTMRRSGYTPRADFQLEAQLPASRPTLSVARYAPGGDSADYILARFTPDVDWKAVKEQRGDVVVVVDTSAAGDEASRRLKAATAEAILRALSDNDRFALVSLDVKPTVLHPRAGLSPASDKEIEKALEALADHAAGGATDLSSMFDVSLARLHGAEQPAIVYVGDGLATSGDMTGEQLVEHLRRALGTSRSRLFTVGVGMDSDRALLSELARAGGGSAFSVDDMDQTTARALDLAAALKVPTITDLEIDLGAGLDEPFSSVSGKVSRGSDVVVMARTHHEIPRMVKVKGRVGGKEFAKEYEAVQDKSVLSAFVPRLWAAEYVRRLLGASAGPDTERGRVVALGTEYGLITPFTSVLALESEYAYTLMGIQRKRSPLRGVQLTALDPREEWRLVETLAAAPPAVAFGCSKLSPSSRDEAAPAEQGATGVRAKGEEGTMAAPLAASPPPEPSPATAAEEPSDIAKLKADSDEGERAALVEKLEGAKQVAGKPAAARAAPTGASPGDPLAGMDDKPSPHAGLALRGAAGGQGRAGKGGVLARQLDQVARPAPAKEWKDAPVLATCSDAAGRPLAQRLLLWRKRLKTADSPAELISRYEATRSSCELNDWFAERTFLELMQKRVDSEGGSELVLRHFSARPEVQKFVAKLILRRTVNAAVVNAIENVLFGRAVDWVKLDLELTEIDDVEKRIERLREAIAKAPEDPNGGIRLVELLIQANKKDEALSLGRRLRDQGFLTPQIARQLGDVLARAKLDSEAVRTYSEIVEFDPDSVESRRLLGDIYLAHAWYTPAYRQYRTLTEVAPADALSWLRLAAAAAGAGRVDEALRLERKVATAEGRPGPGDPRRWARLSSAARLARLLDDPKNKGRAAGIQRELKELQLFSGPGTLVIITWEDLARDLLLTTRVDGTETALGESTDAAAAGLSAALLSTPEAERASFVARLRSVPVPFALGLVRHDIVWNGKAFQVKVQKKQLAGRAAEAEL